MNPTPQRVVSLGPTLLFALLLGATWTAQANTSAANWSRHLDQRLDIFEDVSNRYDAGKFTSGAMDSLFYPIGKKTWLFQPGSIWVKVQLNALEQTQETLYLICGPPYLDTVEFYIPQADGSYRLSVQGDSIDWTEDRVLAPFMTVALRPKSVGSRPIFIRVQSSGSIALSMYLYTELPFLEDLSAYMSQSGAVILGGFVLALFFLCIFFPTRDLSYLSLATWVFALTIMQAAHSGVGFLWLWPTVPALNQYLPTYNLAGVTAFIFFGMTLLNTKEETPRLHRLGMLCACVTGISFCLSLLDPMKLGAPVVPLGYFLSAWTILPALVRATQGYRPARYFVLSFTPGFCFVGWNLLIWTGVAPAQGVGPDATILDRFAGWEGPGTVCLQVVFMALAVADKFNMLRQEKEMAQAAALSLEKAHAHELESKVEAKTIELSRANRKLGELNQYLTERVLTRYLPLPVVDRIVSGDLDFNEKPRAYTATVLFSDLKGFTAMSNQLPAQEVGELLNRYFELMTQLVFDHGGTLDKFIGDGMMVLFGAPMEMPPAEQARRACQCALAMQQEIPNLRQLWKEHGQSSPTCRIGIHQGPVVVGNFGSEHRMDYTSLGTTVNLASRLETACPPGEVLVSQSVAFFLDKEDWRNAGQFALKGFAEKVPAYTLRRSENLSGNESDPAQ